MKRPLRLALAVLACVALVAPASVERAAGPAALAAIAPHRTVAAVAPQRLVTAAQQPEATGLEARIAREALPPRRGNMFEARSWAPPPKAVAPPKPVAPALPFVFLGRMDGGEEASVFLRRGKATVVAREGEALEGAWRLESIGDHQLVFTYLPLEQQVTLPYPR